MSHHRHRHHKHSNDCCDKNVKQECRKEFDYVIVGLGTAGAPLAKLLSDDCNTSVFVIEGGDDRRRDPVVLSSGDNPDLPTTDELNELHWFHPTKYTTPNAYSSSLLNYTEGRMWGGSSGHNYFLAVRGSPDIYDSWAMQSGNTQWEYNQLLPAMIWLETYTPNGTPINFSQRGTKGPLFITQDPVDPNLPFFTATATVNAPYRVDYNDPSERVVMTSASQFYLNPTTVQRSWSASAFLGNDVVDTRGFGVDGRQLEIASHAIASEILFEEDNCGCLRAVGVRYYQAPTDERNQQESDKEKVIDVFARKKVILCAGTIQDATILQRSGIGPRSVLEPIGIEVRVANENVGRNVQNHSGPIAIIPDNPANPIPPLPLALFSDLSGPHVGPPTGIRESQFAVFSGEGIIGFLAWNLRPLHNGTIEIRSSDPTVPALIELHLSEADDLERNIRALKVIADISLAYTGQMPLVPPPEVYPVTFPGGMSPDDSGLRDFIIATLQNMYLEYSPTNHNSGSCRMAESASDGVVDGELNVFGVKGLSVADNAVVPEIETGNTAWTAYIVGLIKAKIEGADVPF